MPSQGSDSAVSHRVGLDIGSRTVKGVEVAELGSEIVIRSAGSAAVHPTRVNHGLPDPPAVAEAIRNLWASGRFVSKKVLLALPPDSAHVKWLRLEPSDQDDLDNIARATAARGAPFPADEAVIDYRVLSSSAVGPRRVFVVMLVAASAAAVDALLDVVARAGLEPVGVDISTAAAVRSLQPRGGNAGSLWRGQPHAHCLVGARSTIVAVVRDGVLEFSRTVPVGGDDFTHAVAEAARIDWARAEKMKTNPDTRIEEDGTMTLSWDRGELRVPCGSLLTRLAREILRSLRFFSSQFAEGSYLGMIDGVTLSGGSVLLRGLVTCLQRNGVEVLGITNPFAGFAVDAEANGIRRVGDGAPAYTTATGLAIGDYWSRNSVAIDDALAA